MDAKPAIQFPIKIASTVALTNITIATSPLYLGRFIFAFFMQEGLCIAFYAFVSSSVWLFGADIAGAMPMALGGGEVTSASCDSDRWSDNIR